MTINEMIARLQEIQAKGKTWENASIQIDIMEVINPITGEREYVENPILWENEG